ncbi:hypothetical protein VOLCADRAFT_121100 [Volvox carteri f. nagariensis]|uniref:COX assembly mitochondrial protein n=1 Tax=Volvox carteri f. nagariensis TaxID=3068 RepID=D8U2E6_VOLCA|nr:uncharacterized protein VOLCADRAFT_121100 [Volvox carteri f. nagariensis]EFJ46120.1 hypothetical protein VOLCADRAFT_121100 [Volvox carteri f. nagariensis]|eukprot:XP_002952870.1 hypothetical protein VOLCADRAFT_121100 [Volvox carteri f. nagariensis]
MHPALIPEKHPLCGKYMEALMQCRKENPYRKYVGVCSEITWQLSACLKQEKKIVREPRQKRFHERWTQKKQEDQERLQKLQQERTATAGTPGAAAAADPETGANAADPLAASGGSAGTR